MQREVFGRLCACLMKPYCLDGVLAPVTVAAGLSALVGLESSHPAGVNDAFEGACKQRWLSLNHVLNIYAGADTQGLDGSGW